MSTPSTTDLDLLLAGPGASGAPAPTDHERKLAGKRVRADLLRVAGALGLAAPIVVLIGEPWFGLVLLVGILAYVRAIGRELRRPFKYLLPREGELVAAVLRSDRLLAAPPEDTDGPARTERIVRLRELADRLKHRTARGAMSKKAEWLATATGIAGTVIGTLTVVAPLAFDLAVPLAAVPTTAGFAAFTWWTRRRGRRREEAISALEDALDALERSGSGG